MARKSPVISDKTAAANHYGYRSDSYKSAQNYHIKSLVIGDINQ
ncbi:hypothetical protein yberc0001_21200 [Yersinia bercovieri ATCC 43970]|uniref:Uncharacterized protein n=1 Tax=Yersinia bercovieri ATCC 43970 TaxID=349968 RepID=A0ABM9XVV9_YERBE|nr:hypothetical protein yberc0001_21200 [Yersinia bercovieri ATCC 43970]